MSQIMLNDILQFSPTEIPDIRIKFNLYNGWHDPLELYKANPNDINITWLLWHDKRRYFSTGQTVLCFLRLTEDTWLLTTIKHIDRELPVDPAKGGVGYAATEVTNLSKYFGRLVIKYHNKWRTIGQKYASVMDKLEVLEILNDHFTGDDFPGYENVCISWQQLHTIISRQLPGWIAALQNQKAVYLICDTHTGRQYVGSATGADKMLLQRWQDYAANGHGGNAELKELVQRQGFDYVKQYFQYAILENYNARMDDDYIRRRENWWKQTLLSREFGYNKN